MSSRDQRMLCVDCMVKISKKQVSKLLMMELEEQWQERWNNCGKGRRVFDFYPEVLKTRTKSDFYINQVITGHGALGPHQGRFYSRDPMCFCHQDVSSAEHVIKQCSNYDKIRKDYFPLRYMGMDLTCLVKDGNVQKGIRIIMSDMVKRFCDLDL